MNQIIDWVTLVTILAPLMISVVNFVGAKTHNQKLKNLADRAQIIVQSLEQTNLNNAAKKEQALNKLSIYAQEVGIKVSPGQVEDYIESSVNLLKLLKKEA